MRLIPALLGAAILAIGGCLTGCGSGGGSGDASCGPVTQVVDVPVVDLSTVEAATDEAGGEIFNEKLSNDGQSVTVIGCNIVGDTNTDSNTSSIDADHNNTNT